MSGKCNSLKAPVEILAANLQSSGVNIVPRKFIDVVNYVNYIITRPLKLTIFTGPVKINELMI